MAIKENDLKRLRKEAGKRLTRGPNIDAPQDIETLLRELESHQVELEIQNDELKAIQAELEQSRNRYFNLFNYAPIAFINLSRNGLIDDVNETAAVMFHLPCSRLIGKRFARFIHQNDRDILQMNRIRAMDERATRHCTLRILTADGEEFHVQMRMQPIYVDGQLKSFELMLTDTTPLRQAEAQLDEVNRNLDRILRGRKTTAEIRSEQLELLARQLLALENRERRRIASKLHDNLQQILVAVGMTLKSAVKASSINAETLENVVEMLEEALQESRSITVELSPPILHERGLLAGLKWLARFFREKFGLQVECEGEDPPQPLPFELAAFLVQATREFLFNICKHAETNKATITIISSTPGMIGIKVHDDGRGFDAGQLQAPNLEKLESYGLHSVRQRISLLKGTLTIKSAPGDGCEVTVELPVYSAEVKPKKTAPQAEVLEASNIVPLPRLSSHGPIQVLIADDHQLVREGVRSALSGALDIEIIGEAENGRIAIEMAQELQPDVILMDVTMPEINGIEATRIIRNTMPGIQIIGLSMHQREDIEAPMLEAGAAHYLDKDCPIEKILSAIRSIAVVA